MAAMRGYGPATPATALDAAQSSSNAESVARLLRGAQRPERLLEFFGGVGRMSKIVHALWPDVPHVVWEWDAECVAQLARLSYAHIHCGDSIAEAEVHPGDGVLFDHNLCTVLRARRELRPVLERVLAAEPMWLVVTDVARSRFWLNWGRAYGLPQRDWGCYVEAWGELALELSDGRYDCVATERASHTDVFMFGRRER
jgi:hypothetical protein